MIKTIIKKLNDSPKPKTINALDEKELVSVIKLASDAYHNSSKQLIDDYTYDLLIDRLKEINPNNPILKKVGSVVWGEDVKLPYWMGSMDKIKFGDIKSFNRFVVKYPGPYVLSDKLDGVSCLVYVTKNEISLYTRGDGEYGKNITHLLNYLIPKSSQKLLLNFNSIAIRGEIIMSKQKFLKYSGKVPNARNMVAGIVNTKPEKLKDEINDVDFVSYEIIEPELLPTEQFDRLKKLKLKTAYNLVHEEISLDSLELIFQDRKKDSEYEIDGIIITQNSMNKYVTGSNPDYSFAYKGPTQISEAEVIAILWEASKDGKLIPRVQIKPVILSGVTITYSTGFDANYIYKNNLGPGAIIRITRSGEVIPYILSVIKPASDGKPSFPDPKMKYHWDDNHVHIVLDDIENNNEVIIKNMTHFAQTIGAEHISLGIINRLVENGIDSIEKLIQITTDDLLTIDGFKERLSEKIVNSLQLALDNMNTLTLMVASNKFGHGFGNRKLKKIMDSFPNIVNQYKITDRQKWFDKIKALDGFSDITTNDFLDHLNSFQTFYTKINQIIKIKPYVVMNKNNKNKFEGEIIVFTGFRNKDWEEIIESNGGKLSSTVSGKTTLLVYNDADTNSSKYLKAIELGIKTLSIDEFSKLIDK
jgi:NAD-dependent DNA ligase